MLSPTADTIRLFLHIAATAVWLGGQLVLGVITPRLRSTFPDATKVVARGFGSIAWPAYALLILTGFWSVAVLDVAETSLSYQITLFIKIALAIAAGAAAAVHQFGTSKAALAIGGAVGLLASLGATFAGVMLLTGT